MFMRVYKHQQSNDKKKKNIAGKILLLDFSEKVLKVSKINIVAFFSLISKEKNVNTLSVFGVQRI